MKLDRKQDLNVLYQGFVFRADRKNKMPALAALAFDCPRHFRLLLWTTERTSTKVDRKQDPLPSFCFRADRRNKMAALASDWLRHFWPPLKPLDGIQRNLTGSKISKFSTKFVFFGPISKQDGRPSLDSLIYFQLLLWNRWTEFNETWQEARSQCPLPRSCYSGYRSRSRSRDQNLSTIGKVVIKNTLSQYESPKSNGKKVMCRVKVFPV